MQKENNNKHEIFQEKIKKKERKTETASDCQKFFTKEKKMVTKNERVLYFLVYIIYKH